MVKINLRNAILYEGVFRSKIIKG